MAVILGRLLILVLLALVVLWLFRGLFSQARRRRALLATRDVRGRPVLPPHQRMTDRELEGRATTLRRALARGDITADEAVASLRRLGGAAVSVERARHLLDVE